MHLFDGTTHPLCRGGRFVAYVALAAICLAGCSPALALNADEVVEQPAIPLPLADDKSQSQLHFEAEVANLENFEASNENLIARDDLPCESDATLQLQCASVRRIVRDWPKRVKKGTTTKGKSQLFTEAYRPQDSRHFDVAKSSTFSAKTEQRFDLHYADGTHLRGFTGIDQAYMGDFHATSPFAVITDCNSPDFNGVDGILGFGIPKTGSNYPDPILFAFTDPNNKDTNAKGLQRKFSFFSTDDAAEVQLGGYDPETTAGTMWYTPALSKQDFIVGVTSLKFGNDVGSAIELLQFKSAADSRYGAPSIMDSGTSCLVIPGDTMGGQLSNIPWNDFSKNWGRGKSFWLKIGDKTWEIPFKQWYLQDTQQTCVQPAPSGMQGILVGDVFFREYVVEFDMTEDRPVIGIAPLSKTYRPVKTNTLSSFKLDQAPKTKLKLIKGFERMYPAEHTEVLTEVDRIPIVNQYGTQYFMDVGLGSPRQTFTVIFDTGSTVFGVFTYKNQLPQDIKSKLPAYYFSQNLKPLRPAGVPLALLQLPAGQPGRAWTAAHAAFSWGHTAAALAAAAAGLVLAAAAARRAHGARTRREWPGASEPLCGPASRYGA